MSDGRHIHAFTIGMSTACSTIRIELASLTQSELRLSCLGPKERCRKTTQLLHSRHYHPHNNVCGPARNPRGSDLHESHENPVVPVRVRYQGLKIEDSKVKNTCGLRGFRQTFGMRRPLWHSTRSVE